MGKIGWTKSEVSKFQTSKDWTVVVVLFVGDQMAHPNTWT